MNFTGLIIGLSTFLCIVFMLLGIGCVVGSLFVGSVLWAAVLGVAGFSSLWSILELFKQRRRVEKGWFPRNPKRSVTDEKRK